MFLEGMLEEERSMCHRSMVEGSAATSTSRLCDEEGVIDMSPANIIIMQGH